MNAAKRARKKVDHALARPDHPEHVQRVDPEHPDGSPLPVRCPVCGTAWAGEVSEPAREALLNAYPWARSLPPADVQVFADELAEAGEPDREAVLAAWQGTAEIWADPELLKAARAELAEADEAVARGDVVYDVEAVRALRPRDCCTVTAQGGNSVVRHAHGPDDPCPLG
jgi:hypothetical protein